MAQEATTAPLTLDELKPSTPVTGKVSRLMIYGAMVDIGLEKDALLHISQLGRSDFHNIEDVLEVGQELDAYVLKVDRENERVALTTVKPPALPWEQIKTGETYTGTVTRIEKFGAFVDIGAERPGMVHVSELADGFVQSPSDVVSIGSEVEVRVIKLDKRKRQIDLSMKTSVEEYEEVLEPDEDVPTAMAIALRRAMEEQEEEAASAARRNEKARADDEQEEIINRTLRSHSNS